MRLKNIKLSGFKSFVDPTTINFSSNLSAIVGPNGCGKSNVIDAVRWVMGESSAKNLRGESMSDVIFNGSSSRKPVSQAFIELVFDNGDGSLGGEYANFAEIAIKRLVTRDGQSNYFLNGVKCRRKDITDIFLGTGLGPRSYAIIEQGMISRLIEAKPEDLRIFIEEAAGISKYKERRRETENRMKRTRENLDRLEDLREELARQLEHLNRQAQAAEKYKEFKEEERLLKAQLQALKWKGIDDKISEKDVLIRDLETKLESHLAERQNAETGIEKQRQLHTDLNDEFNEVQAKFYTIGADIARIEQSIQHQKQRHQQLHNDIDQTESSLKETTEHLSEDKQKIETLSADLLEIEPELAILQEKESESSEILSVAEESMQGWQSQWDEFNHEAAEPRQVAQVEQSRIQHLDQSIQRIGERIDRLQKEAETIISGPLEKEMMEIEAKLEAQEEKVNQMVEHAESYAAQINEIREINSDDSRQLDQLRSELQSAKGRHASLEALQQAAMGQKGGSLVQWLSEKGLSTNKRLAEDIKVDSGWEKAVETVLGDSLQAVCCEDGIDPVIEVISTLEYGPLTILEKSSDDLPSSAKAKTLASVIQSSTMLPASVASVYVAESLEEASALRNSLSHGESVITKDGIWLGANWLRVTKEEDAQHGILQRETELKELGAIIEGHDELIEALSDKLDLNRSRLKEMEEGREDSQKDLRVESQNLSELQAQASARKVRMEQFAARRERIDSELSENKEHLNTEQESLGEARLVLQDALDTMEKDSGAREILLKTRDELRAQLDSARLKAREDRDQAHLLVVQTETYRTQLESTTQGMDRLISQEQVLSERKASLLSQLKEVDEPASEQHEQLEELLQKRVVVEEQMIEARAKLDEADHALREIEKLRNQADLAAQDVRSSLEKQRMEWQGYQVERKNLQEQLDQSEYDVQALLDELPEAANESQWEADLEKISQRIARLGAINLAAIDEYKAQSERKTYLDAQYDDLIEALETLESAIKKIDKETRTRFKETFDKLNAGLQDLFPKVFGGGHAYLELTGDELLDTGVAIMARPPGKRNSTIHLLSGGEKAMTAIALVFSIFQMNPAPFCILDEVDAPLDDANVGRYCKLVESMSEKVQFIYITHNKIAMEMAHYLMGVTMHEAGCSRIVAVDVDEAAKMAAL